MSWNEEHRCWRDGEMHPTTCEECDCRHYRWGAGLTNACTCKHGATQHRFRPNCAGVFDAQTEADLRQKERALVHADCGYEVIDARGEYHSVSFPRMVPGDRCER